MITLQKYFELTNYRITSSDCMYGPYRKDNEVHGFFTVLESTPDWGKNDIRSGAEVRLTEDGTVMCVSVHDYYNNRAYRMVNPDYAVFMDDEAWDDGESVKYIDLDVDEDFIEKATAIMNGLDYDTRVTIQLELSEQEELMLFRQAHKADMTVNDYVVKILTDYIENQQTMKLLDSALEDLEKSDPYSVWEEGFKQDASYSW